MFLIALCPVNFISSDHIIVPEFFNDHHQDISLDFLTGMWPVKRGMPGPN